MHPICWRREHRGRFWWHAFEWATHLPTRPRYYGRVCISELWSWCSTSAPVCVCGSWFSSTYVILDSGCTRAMGSRFAIDRLKPGNNIQSVTTFGFQNNHVQVNSHLQMENNPLSRRDLWFISDMIMHTLVGLLPALTSSTRVRFLSSFLLNKCGTCEWTLNILLQESFSLVHYLECNAPLSRSVHPITRFLTLWLLQHQVGNRCTVLNQKKLHALRSM